MDPITIQPQTKEQFEAVKAFLKALKIPFQKKEERPYNPEFVKMVKMADTEKGGKVVKAETLWEDLGL